MATIIRVPAARPTAASVKPKIFKVSNNPNPVKLSAPPSRTAHDDAFRAAAPAGLVRVPRAPTIAPPPPPPVKPSFNYANAYITDPRYTKGVAAIGADQSAYGASYGLVINRDTNPDSPTRGMALFRPKGTTSGSGNITAKIDPVTGVSTYSDPSGKTYTAAEIEMDIMQIARGQEGYLKGSLGNTQEQSNNNQFNIANNSAQRGAGKSGMRVQAASDEVASLQNALSRLTTGYGSDLAGTTIKYQDLLNTIYPTVLENATAYGTPAPDAPTATPDAPAAPPATPSYLPPGQTEVAINPNGTFSQGESGTFMAAISNLTSERNTNDAAIREQLTRFLRDKRNKFTPRQIAYIKALISGKYSGKKSY